MGRGIAKKKKIKKNSSAVMHLAGFSSTLIVGPKNSQEFLAFWVCFVGKPTQVLKHVKISFFQIYLRS